MNYIGISRSMRAAVIADDQLLTTWLPSGERRIDFPKKKKKICSQPVSPSTASAPIVAEQIKSNIKIPMCSVQRAACDNLSMYLVPSE